MHTHAEASSTFGRTRLSFADEAEIDEFVRTLDAYERGELTPDQWRAFRLVRGTYGQRQTGDAQMLRIKIPQGILDGPQLVALADVAERYSRGFAATTPTALLLAAGTPRAHTWIGPLEALAAVEPPAGLEDAPGTIVVGDVVGLSSARAQRSAEEGDGYALTR